MTSRVRFRASKLVSMGNNICDFKGEVSREYNWFTWGTIFVTSRMRFHASKIGLHGRQYL